MVWFFGIPREERGKGKGKEGVSALFDFLFIFTRGNHVVVNRHFHPPSQVPVAAGSLAGGASSLLPGEGGGGRGQTEQPARGKAPSFLSRHE